MPSDEQAATTNSEETSGNTTSELKATEEEASNEKQISETLLKAKELYSQGSRNFLVKSYEKAADQLSDVCTMYVEIYGDLADEVGMPYLLYAKSLIALALDENKVIDVPDEEEDDDDEEDEEDNGGESADVGATVTEKNAAENGKQLEGTKESVADSTAEVDNEKKVMEPEKIEESQVSSTAEEKERPASNGKANGAAESTYPIDDGEKPSTSNEEPIDDEEEGNEAAFNLQLAWEILNLAAKIFTRQGERGLPNLAEVQTELANIEFENNNLDAAREDYQKALNIYKSLPNNYRRAKAEIYYKIGLTYLMQQLNNEGAESFKQACTLIAGEIDEIKAKTELSQNDKNNIQDMEETMQEIEAKILEIEETQAQNIAEVRAALDSYIKPRSSNVDAGSSTSAAAAAAAAAKLKADGLSSSAAISSSSKPTDISHLIKRKKPEEPTSEAEAALCSPAKKKPAL